MEIKGDDIPGILMGITTLMTAFVAAIVSIVTLYRSNQNAAAIKEVHQLTNSLSERAQTQAREAGLAEGAAKARADMVALAGADALAREQGRPLTVHQPADKPTGTKIAATVVTAVEKVAEKSLDPLATAVADKVIEKTTETKP